MVYDSFNKNQIQKRKKCLDTFSILFNFYHGKRSRYKSKYAVFILCHIGFMSTIQFFISETFFSYSPSMLCLFSDNNMTGNRRVNRRRRVVRAGRGYPPTSLPPPGPHPATDSPW